MDQLAKHISEHDKTYIDAQDSTVLITDFSLLIAHANYKNSGKQVLVVKRTNFQILATLNRASKGQNTGVVGFATSNRRSFANEYLDHKCGKNNILAYTVPEILSTYLTLQYNKHKDEGIAGLDLHFCDVLIIDEAGSGHTSIDFLLYMYNICYDAGALLPKIVIINNNNSSSASKVFTFKRNLPEILYHDEDLNTHSSHFLDSISAIINAYILQNQEKDLAILCYLGSDDDVIYVSDQLQGDKANVIKLFGGEKDYENIRYLESTGIRILLATSESDGISFDNIDYVFDALYKKKTFKGEIKHYYISKDLADRRALVGKKCYRLSTEKYYNMSTSNIDIHDLNTSDAEPVYLSLLLSGLNPQEFFLSTGMTEDSLSSIIDGLSKYDLVRLSERVELTDLGKFVVKSSISFREAIVAKKSNTFVGYIFAAIVMFGNVKTDQTETEKYILPGFEYNDIATDINIILQFLSKISNFDIRSERTKIKTVCLDMKIDTKIAYSVAINLQKWYRKSINIRNLNEELSKLSHILEYVYLDRICLVKNKVAGGNLCTSNVGKQVLWKHNYDDNIKVNKILPFDRQITLSDRRNKVTVSRVWSWNSVKLQNKPVKKKCFDNIDLSI